MFLEPTFISGLSVLRRPVHEDERGCFTRIFELEGISVAGRPTKVEHINASTSVHPGTLRGIHYQYPPYSETKIVACTAGSIWDVAVDLRPASPTRFLWYGTTLTPANGLSLIVPEGFGHAFITLEPNSTAIYVCSAAYSPSHESGISFNDSQLNITWPIKPSVLSLKDQAWGPIVERIAELDTRFAAIKP